MCLRANPDPETPSSAEEDALRLVLHEQSSYRDQSISVTLCRGYLKSGLALGSLSPRGHALRPGHISLTL